MLAARLFLSGLSEPVTTNTDPSRSTRKQLTRQLASPAVGARPASAGLGRQRKELRVDKGGRLGRMRADIPINIFTTSGPNIAICMLMFRATS